MAVSVTLKFALTVPMFPSVTVTSEMAMPGCGRPSSLMIVPTPWLSVTIAFAAAPRLTKNVSSGSTTTSPMMPMKRLLVVAPGKTVNEPLFVW